MISTKNEELDHILAELPGVQQTGAVEDTRFIRFTIELHIDPADHPNPPELFILFGQDEFRQARSVPRKLEAALRNKIAQTSFLDGSSGAEIRTSLYRTATAFGLRVRLTGRCGSSIRGRIAGLKAPLLSEEKPYHRATPLFATFEKEEFWVRGRISNNYCPGLSSYPSKSAKGGQSAIRIG